MWRSSRAIPRWGHFPAKCRWRISYTPDREKAQARLYAPEGEKLLMHVSNFRPVKRVQDCVRILAEVLRHTHLVMVGDGPERGPAEHLARELGLERHVSFLGKQNHVERIIPLAHVLLMPSDLESFGLVALEAMACGVPPVATRVGGVHELITYVDGYLEAVRDIAAQAARGEPAHRRRIAQPRVGRGPPHRHRALLHGPHHPAVRAVLRRSMRPPIGWAYDFCGADQRVQGDRAEQYSSH
jgi:hypothetical protein